jgi:NAD(P)-dependent dehydrogenase (short-subunit alcohol dehydrogenase family)
MMRVMAREWAKDSVTVNAKAPGYIETNLTASISRSRGSGTGSSNSFPPGRLGTPDELAGPVLYLAHPTRAS